MNVTSTYPVLRLMTRILMSCENSAIETASTKNICNLKWQNVSKLFWLRVDELFMRSTNLRWAWLPSRTSTPAFPLGVENWEKTVSIHVIAKTYRNHPNFYSQPVLFHYEKHPKINKLVPVLYEGRHRALGAKIANRTYILGRQIWKKYSSVISQNLPESAYFRKPLYSIHEISDLYKNNFLV